MHTSILITANIIINAIKKSKMENKKQSSVDWLFDQLCSEKFSWIKGSNDKIYFDKITSDLLQQAKAMHKEEIKMIIEHYHNRMFYLELTGIELENITEMIYKETFGGQDNE